MRDDAAHYARIGTIVGGARELRGAGLTAYLEAACGGDASIRAEVVELLALAGDDDQSAALAEPAVEGTRRALEGLVDDATRPWLPEKIGEYRILRQLGQGGMGVVYEAEQTSPRRRVALKLLHPMQATAERLRRFRHETALLGRLQHPGIAQIFEAGTYDVGRGAQPFFAMELVLGVDIRTHCERERLARAARIELLARVADAVQYAHEHGIIHRDLKPDNVLVDEQGNPRILDFGIARASGHSTTLSTLMTAEGQMVGTLAYMAPEQLARAEDAVTPRVDVYALGVLGFELLAGRRPLEIEDLSLSQAITQLATSEAPRASTFDASLRGDLDTILGKALEHEPGRRYASAADLAGDLRRHLAHLPILARPPSRIYLARKFTRRHRGLVAGTVATLLTLVAGTIVAIVLARRASDQRDLAVASEQRALNGLLQSTQFLLDSGRGRDAAAQLRLVPEASRGLSWRLLDRAVPFVMEAPRARWRFVDDEHMVAVVGDRVLLYSLLEHRTIRELFRGEGILHLGSPASSGIVPALTSHEYLLLDLERGIVLERSPAVGATLGEGLIPVNGFFRSPEVSDDGRVLLRCTRDDTADVRAEVRVDGEVVRVISGLSSAEAAHLGKDGRSLVVNRRGEVSVLDVVTGAVRFHHTVEPGGVATGFPVRGGLLLLSGREPGSADFSSQSRGRRVWRRIALADAVSGAGLADPFSAGFAAPDTLQLAYSFDYPRDGRFVAVWRDAGAHLADTETGAPLTFAGLTSSSDGQDGFVPFESHGRSLADVSPSGRRLALTSTSAQTVILELDPRLNDPRFDQRVLTLCGHTGNGFVYGLALSNDGSLIASAAPMDALVRVWDLRSGDCVATLERDCEEPGSWDALLAFSPLDDRLVLTTPFGGRGVCLVDWSLHSGEVEVRAELATRGGSHLELLDAFVDLLAPGPRARLNQRVQMQDGGALAAHFLETSYKQLSASEFPRPMEGRRWRYVPKLEGLASGISLHPSAPEVAVVQDAGNHSVARNGRLLVLDTDSGAVLAERELDFQPWCVDYSPDGSVLAIGTNEGRVLLFETEGTTQQLEWRAHESYVYCLAWTPDGTRLVTASGDATLRIWDTRTRVASLLEEDRWQALRKEMAGRVDVGAAFAGLAGEERQAARIERIRRVQAR